MSACRGIIVAGVTNRARTQIAEAFLRVFTRGRVFVCSGALDHGGLVHPLAISTMADVGIDIGSQSSSSLAGARRQRDTYDVYVSIDAPYSNRASDRYQRLYQAYGVAGEDSQLNTAGFSSPSASCTFSDLLLASPTPAHWAVARDSTDNRQSWTLWSPRDPAIFYENSTRKFQDHLYEGEPLFMRVRANELRKACRVQRRWEMEEVNERYAMETEAEQRARFAKARDLIASLTLSLVRDLESVYGEELEDATAVAAYRQASHTWKEM